MPTTWEEIEARRRLYKHDQAVRVAERKRLLTLLTTNANDFERIGRRAVLAEFLHSEASKQRGERLSLAQRMNVSPARISTALSAIEAELGTTEMLTSEADPENPDNL